MKNDLIFRLFLTPIPTGEGESRQNICERIGAIFLLASTLILAASAKPVFAGQVLTGIDVLEQDGFSELQGKKIGLVTNQTGKDLQGRSTAQVLAQAQGVELKALFAPEHGFAGMIENANVSSGTLRLSDGREIPIYSLYGSRVPLTGAIFSGLNALIFDMQDVGARFYTYSTTMGLVMETAAKYHIPFYVLDRPNPITGNIVEGPVLDLDIRSFFSYFPIPVRHGLTMGEIARLHNARIKGDLHVIPLKGWSRDLWYDQTGLPWTQPSPNIPDLDSAILYPGIACLEAANLSVGRGTPAPFRWIGAPWLKPRKILNILKQAKLEGVEFERHKFKPTKDIYKGQKCPGIYIRVTDRNKARPLDIFAVLVCALRDTHSKTFHLQWTRPAPGGPAREFFMPTTQRLVGAEKFRELYESGADPEEIMKFFKASAASFEEARQPFLIY